MARSQKSFSSTPPSPAAKSAATPSCSSTARPCSRSRCARSRTARALREELSRSAQAARDRGDLPEAIALHRRLAELGSAAAAPWLRLGTLYLEAAQQGLAMDAFEKARALEPGNGDVLCMLGATLSD